MSAQPAAAAAAAAAPAAGAPATGDGAAPKPDTKRPPKVNAAAGAKDKPAKQPKASKPAAAGAAAGGDAKGADRKRPPKKDTSKAKAAAAGGGAVAAGDAAAAPAAPKGCGCGEADAAALAAEKAVAAEAAKKAKRAERTNKSIGASASASAKAGGGGAGGGGAAKKKRELPVCEFEYFDAHTHLDFIFESVDAQHKADRDKALAKEKDEGKRKALAEQYAANPPRAAAYDWYAAQNFLGAFGGCVTVCCEAKSIEPTLALIDADLKADAAAVAPAAAAAAAAGTGAAADAKAAPAAAAVDAKSADAKAVAGAVAGAAPRVLGRRIFAAFGLHPHDAKHWTPAVEKRLRDIVSTHPRALAWGECGLDYYYKLSDPEVQKSCFRAQLRCAVELRKPLVIHSRDAEADTVALMTECVPADWPIHLHCFTGTLQMAQTMLQRFPKLCIGFTGCITFSSAQQNRDVVKAVPIDRLLLETDGPYMAPEPFRGAISHPGMIPLTAQVMADVKGVTLQQLLAQVRLNVTKIYGV